MRIVAQDLSVEESLILNGILKGWDGMDGIHLAQKKDLVRALVNM
jgi:hypothetical protein